MDLPPTSLETFPPDLLDAKTVGDSEYPGKSGSVPRNGLSQSVGSVEHRLSPNAKILILFGVAILTITASTLLVSGFVVLAGPSVKITYPYFTGAVVLLSIAGIFPIYKLLPFKRDPLTFTRGFLTTNFRPGFESEITEAADIDHVAAALRRRIRAITSSNLVHIFIYDPATDHFIAACIDGEKSSDLQFHRNSLVVQALSAQKKPLLKIDRLNSGAKFPIDETRLELLGANALFPLVGKEQLLGWIALGGRSNHRPLTIKQIDSLEQIASHAARTMERFQLVTRLENRMHQMDALSRVAQGVNFTLALDDIFELIYAQTTHILPADEFRILLFESYRKDPVLVFSILGNERRMAEEKQILASDQLPEFDSVCQGKLYTSSDYARECRKRGCPDREEGRMAVWAAVPLRAGAETIGAVCLGCRDLDNNYTLSQQELLQGIADQAAGAIVKARLLGEADKRTHQLRTLYDMTRQLTSTLDQERLLKNILQSAVEILDCEAGSLLMADEQSNQLVFKVTLGPVAGDLYDKRMPVDVGVVGKSFSEREPVIVNDVRDSTIWFAHNDQSTGFATHSLMVVPMQVKDRVLGVIEVVNHKDGSGFSQDDQELLSAFAAQAAVAIENARLYTMTDQALAARVEELSVMQQIDRELNTSLDVNRALNITLEWAMRQSGAAAGMIGMVEPDGIRLMASQGYRFELEGFSEDLLPARKMHMDLLTEDGRPVKVYPPTSAEAILNNAKSQVVIPIQREKSVTGLILLESDQAEVCSQDALNFLTRLSDHASIAIANAQLYNAVQAANEAKSEFVSFVAHELKNPMTSIKGYTELLAARAVGPVTETQGNFLQVIRTNIDRMNTLVSDLNDLSKIEAGRLRLEYSAIALKDVVSEVERSLRRQIEDKRQIFETDFPENLPKVWSDRNRLVQILVNLVSNAQKYTEPGGKIKLGAAVPGEINNRAAADGLHVWVQDNGIGITLDDQTRIFQKFFRSDDPKTREASGAGLGLNITRSLVEMQGGRIWFESEFRKGTTFHFTIPLAE